VAAGLIELRPLQPADAFALHEFRVRNRAFLAPWEPLRDEAHYSLDAARSAIEAQRADRQTDRGYAYGVFAGADLVGFVNLNAVVRGVFQNAYVGYGIGAEWNGHGYATEAVRSAARIAFGELRLHRLQASVIPRNVGSIRVVEKAGFRREGLAERYLCINGVWEDHLIFALTSDETAGSARTPRSPR
jgi:[ribosomal protein S5]-alanine N-acetyltransferase